MRTYRFVPGVVVGLWMIAQSALVSAETPVAAYQTEMSLIQTTVDGKEITVCRPCVMAAEGQAAVVEVGMKLVPPKEVGVQEPLQAGYRFVVKVFRKDGQLFLDATANLAETLRADAKSVRIGTTGLRVVEAMTLCKKVIVPLPDGQNGSWEFLVQEPQPNQPKAAGE